MEVYFATAIRRVELVRMKIEHIELEKGILTIVEGKGLKDRRLPIAQRACDWMSYYLDEVRPKFVTIDLGDATFYLETAFLLIQTKLASMSAELALRN